MLNCYNLIQPVACYAVFYGMNVGVEYDSKWLSKSNAEMTNITIFKISFYIYNKMLLCMKNCDKTQYNCTIIHGRLSHDKDVLFFVVIILGEAVEKIQNTRNICKKAFQLVP